MIEIREEAFRYYFYFIQERMNIFWNQYLKKGKRSKDEIFREYKFTNVYRVCDRVSQFLISKIIYNNNKDFSEEDIVFRIILFKIFNKIETWEYIERVYGKLKIKNYDPIKISNLLTERIKKKPIFNSAYIINGTHIKYNDNHAYKHEKWLHMLDNEIIREKRIPKILNVKSLHNLYSLLIDCSFIGPFLAYQFSVDLNYSKLINFDENSFVKAGIGAIRGIEKCFKNKSGKSYEYLINFTLDNFEKYQSLYGYSLKNLFGRNPTLIDLQNCFCETDKYLRVALPELNIQTKRIKQKYKPVLNPINYYFPPKWGLKEVK